MLAFSAAGARVLVRGRETSCSCFGRLSTRPVGPSTLARNLALAAAAAFVAVAGWRDPGPGVTDWSPSLSGAEAALVAGLALLGLVAVVQAAFSWQLLAQNGRLAARVRALEEATTRIGPGAPLPELELTDTHGRTVSRSELLAGGEPVLVFTHAACEACEPVLAAIAQRRDAGGPRPVVIAGGDPEANREKAAAYGLDPFLLEPGGRAHRVLGLDAVPAAVPVTAGGRIRVAPAVGPDAVRALVVPA
jgi:hypothetical protein